MNTNAYSLNHTAKTIEITREFAKASSTIGTDEYKNLVQLMRDFPAYSVTQRKIRKSDSKKTYSKLTYDNMKTFILLQKGEASTELKQFDKVLALSKVQSGGYGYVKKWFLATFPEYDETPNQATSGEENMETDASTLPKIA